MKKAISVSLGSRKRDHKGTIKFGNDVVEVSREGTDGDVKEMIRRYEELDGNVDALGAGGYMFGFHVGGRYWKLREAYKIISHVKKTPIVDGHGVKDTIERYALQMVWDEIEDLFEGKPKTALMTAAVDRYGMTEGIVEAGFECTFGDMIFGLGIPIKIKSLKGVNRLARLFLPIASKFPMSWLYPTGHAQEVTSTKYVKYFKEPTLIAGDFLYTKKYAPKDMEGKVILTNTTTAADIEDFKERGIAAIITTTPVIEGRSFGTNVLEAAITAHAGLGRPLTRDEMLEVIKKYNLKPQVRKF